MPEELVLVVPRDGSDGRARLARRSEQRCRRVPGGHRAGRPVRPAIGDGGGPSLQAGHPVPGPPRPRSHLPDAAHAGRRRCAPPRAALDRGRWPPEPGRRGPGRRPGPRVGGGARRRLRPRVPPPGPAQRRRDGRRASPRRRRVRRRGRGPAGGRSRDREARRAVRLERGPAGRPRSDGDPGASSSSTSSSAAAPGSPAGYRARGTRCPTAPERERPAGVPACSPGVGPAAQRVHTGRGT